MAEIGLRNVHFAPLLDDGTYDKPALVAPAINVTATPNINTTTLYADDKAVAVASGLGDIDISLGVKDLINKSYDLLMGTKMNEDGVIEDNVDDVSPYGALLFSIPLEGGGFKYYAYYKGRFQPPGASHQTKGESVEFQTPTITGKFMAREDGKWRAHLTDPDNSNPVAKTWFNEVYTQDSGE